LPASGADTDLRPVIADVNRVLRGWGQYFRTGNAATRFVQLDRYVEERLRGLPLKRAGSRLAAGRADVWRRPFFEAPGARPPACVARFGIRCMLRPEVHLESRVREIRTHGLNGGLASSRSVPPTDAQ